MSSELEDIILTIDVHEEANKKEKTRIATIKSYVESHGCENVLFKELKHGDYEIIGHFRSVPVNVIIEYKTWDNFLSDDIAEMEEKLLLATGTYDHVGFFVETQNYSFVPDESNKHSKLNYSIPRLNKNLPAKTLAAFEGFLDTISKHPQIHVRQLRGEGQFPYSLYDLLVYLQSEHGMTRNGYLNKNIFLAWYKSLLAAIPSLKSESTRNGTMTKKRIEKVIAHYPNLFWLCSASEESLMQVMGKQIGMTIYTVLHYNELITPEWKAGHHLDGTEKDELDQVQKYGDGAQTLVKSCAFATPDPKNRTECKTPNHFKQHSKIPSHAEGTILSNHNHPLPSADTFPSHPSACGNIPVHKDAHVVEGDTSSHAGEISSPTNGCLSSPADNTSSHPDRPQSQIDSIPQQRSGDLPQPPITKTETTAVKQEGLSVSFFPPAEINIGLDDKPLECVIKCRACHQTIDDCNDDETGFCQDPDCIKIRKEPSLENKLRIFLREPHTVEEIVEKYGCSTGYTHQVCMANVKSGNIKKITEQDGRVTFQRIIC